MSQQSTPTKNDFTIIQWTWVVYILQIASLFTLGLLSIIGLIINLVKRDAARRDPTANSHFGWQIHTLFWSVLWNIVGYLTLWAGIGYLILVLTFLWSIYRPIRGMYKLSKNHLI